MQKYKIIKTLGDGSFGTVFKAVNLHDNEIVAIKKMKQKYRNWDDCLQLREVKSLRKLHHPNLIRLLEVLRIDEELYLVFDFLQLNLFQVYNNAKEKGRKFTENEIKTIVYQIAAGLGHLHRSGFFHRDMKPQNILFGGDTVKLCDFGLAREIRSRPPFTDYVSTRWYRAPELLLRSPVYNSPVDIFALGLIMAELYLLNPLLPGANEIDQLNKTVALLGTPNKSQWPEGYKLATALNYKFPECKKTQLYDLIPEASAEAIDLMESMLQYSPRNRPSAADILKHPFFEKMNLVSETVENKENKAYTKFQESAENHSILMPESLKVENPKQMELRKTKLKFGGGGENKRFESNISQKFDELEELLMELTKDKNSVTTTHKEPTSANKEPPRPWEKELEQKLSTDSKFPQIGKARKEEVRETQDPVRFPNFSGTKSIGKIQPPLKLSFDRSSKEYLLPNNRY